MKSFSKAVLLGLITCLSLQPVQGQTAENTKHDSDLTTEFDQARHVFHRVYFEKASLLFEDFLKKEPDHSLALAYQAMINLMLYKSPDEIAAKVESLVKKDNPADLFAQALIHFVKSDFKGCESALKKHLNHNPDDPYGLHVLGFTQIDDGRPEDGLETLLHLLDIQPNFYPAFNHTAYAYLRLNQMDEAIKYFKLFLESDSLNPSAHDSYADGLENIGEYDRAISHLTRAILLEPGFAYGWSHMGSIYKKTGELELAGHAYEKAIKSANLYGEQFVNSMKNNIKELIIPED